MSSASVGGGAALLCLRSRCRSRYALNDSRSGVLKRALAETNPQPAFDCKKDPVALGFHPSQGGKDFQVPLLK